MKNSAKAVVIVMAGTLSVSACESNEEMWGVLGAGLGAVGAGLLVGDDDGLALAAAVVAGAAVGGWLGANFGRGLDEAERQRVANTTQQVLAQDIPSSSPLRTASAAYSPQAAAAAPTVAWTSPSNPQTVSGKTTLLQVQAQGSSGECRTVRQLVVVDGVEDSQDTQFCRSGPGAQWSQA